MALAEPKESVLLFVNFLSVANKILYTVYISNRVSSSFRAIDQNISRNILLFWLTIYTMFKSKNARNTLKISFLFSNFPEQSYYTPLRYEWRYAPEQMAVISATSWKRRFACGKNDLVENAVTITWIQYSMRLPTFVSPSQNSVFSEQTTPLWVTRWVSQSS